MVAGCFLINSIYLTSKNSVMAQPGAAVGGPLNYGVGSHRFGSPGGPENILGIHMHTRDPYDLEG